MKIVAVVEARMASTRLPGKVMMPIMGKPVLGYLLERLKRCRSIDKIVVATSLNAKDDAIEDYCREMEVGYFRGSEDDVLDRILGAAKSVAADVGVEIYGDCPFLEPEIIDRMIKIYLDNTDKYDFVSTNLKITFPPGVGGEVYSVKALEDSARRASSAEIREHGTLYMRLHPEIYRLYNIEAPPELHYPDMDIIELDTEEDFIVIEKIIEALYPENPLFTIHDIIKFSDQNPQIRQINKDVHRRWKKYIKDAV